MKISLLSAALFGALGVALGAFGAHGLKATLENRDMLHVWETAVLYQLVHAVAIAATCAHLNNGNVSAWIARGRLAWIGGIVLFSGSLYCLALGGPRWLGPVTPLGGLFFIAGWVCLGIGALKVSASDRR